MPSIEKNLKQYLCQSQTVTTMVAKPCTQSEAYAVFLHFILCLYVCIYVMGQERRKLGK